MEARMRPFHPCLDARMRVSLDLSPARISARRAADVTEAPDADWFGVAGLAENEPS
jgi:hypothetical protein